MSLSNISEMLSKRIRERENPVQEQPKPKVKLDRLKCVREVDVGITEYIRQGPGFSAVIKQRYTDFEVREVDLEGRTAKLTTMTPPVFSSSTKDVSSVLDPTISSQLDSLLDGTSKEVVIDVSTTTKDERRELHNHIKSKCGKSVTSNTVEDGEVKKIIIKVSSSRNRDDRWPEGIGKFLHFIVLKSNEDTSSVVSTFGRMLKAKPYLISYAGTKDKRGQTTQWMCIKGVKAERMLHLNKVLKNIKTGNYEYKTDSLRLGDLLGNRFKIALRNVQAENSTIEDAMSSLQQTGFINYYGLQRFGNCAEVPTHEIGKRIIKSDFKSAVDLILQVRPDTDSFLSKAREIWAKDRNAKEALKVLGRKSNSIEGKLLFGLSKSGENDYVGALGNIPRNSRLLYVHAYQSYIWNTIVSRRIKELGMDVLVGDLVLKEKAKEDLEHHVEILTEETINNYTIYDVVYPLPGHAIVYPKNVIKEWYEDLLKKDDLSFSSFKQVILDYSLPGGYRNMLSKVKDMTYSVLSYSKPEEDLILSDFDALEGRSLSVQEGEFKAIILEFTLDLCSYATMALREVLKIDTSTNTQTALNSYGNKRDFDGEDDVGGKKKKTEESLSDVRESILS